MYDSLGDLRGYQAQATMLREIGNLNTQNFPSTAHCIIMSHQLFAYKQKLPGQEDQITNAIIPKK